MKKIIYVIIVILLLTGCSNEQEKTKTSNEKEEKIKKEVELPTYQDQNTTPISFYELKGNELVKLSSITSDFESLEDIGLFQIYPSTEGEITLTDNFSNSYYKKWQTYKNQYPIQLGFSLRFTLESKEEVFYNILSPNDTMNKWEYIMTYLYDDYKNQGKAFYSHIEPEEYTEETLFTAIKLQYGAYIQKVSSPIYLTVFTYDSEDDFLEGKYRGNSQATLTICQQNSSCEER